MPEHSEGSQQYKLTLEQLAIEPISGEMATVKTNELPVNDNEESELSEIEDDQPKGLFGTIAKYL